MCRLLAIPLIFAGSSLFLWLLVRSAPPIVDDHNDFISARQASPVSYTYTFSITEQFYNVTNIALDLHQYKEDHYTYVLTVYVVAYIYKQSFAIPGSFFLNVIGGALFGVWQGLLLSCVLTTTGATICFLLSEAFGKQYVLYYFGSRVSYLQQKVDQNTQSMFLFLLFARLLPISPSWLLNIIAPYLEIPLGLFVVTVFLGLAPYNYLCVQAGSILSEIHSWRDIFDMYTILQLSSLALIPLFLSIFIKPRTHQQLTQQSATSQKFAQPPIIIVT